MTFKLKINPRYKAAPFEFRYFKRESGKPAKYIKLPWPIRYETHRDAMIKGNPVPYYLKVYEDGTTEESW